MDDTWLSPLPLIFNQSYQSAMRIFALSFRAVFPSKFDIALLLASYRSFVVCEFCLQLADSMSVYSTRSTNRVRKHSKTFTGCWTCRARKVKCDERHPACNQCINKDICCGGYDIRLNWMTPNTGLEDDAQVLCDDIPHATKSFRSRILSGSPLLYQVDEILGAIDVLSSEQPIKYNNEREHSHFIGGFGVFDSTKSNNNEVHINHDTVEKDLSSSQEANQSLSPPSDLQFTDFTCALESNHTSVTQPTAPTGTLVSADERGTAQSSFTFSFSDVLDLMPDAENTAVDQDQYDSYISRNDIGDESPQHNLSAIFSPTIPRPPRPVHLTENEHLLIHYYTTKVVHIFPALDSPKSPWKTFHLPRVLQSIAEMAVQGSSSLIRAALRSTLLSVSAFFLSKHMRTQSQIEQSTKWETEAMRFHGTGMRLLKESVNAKFASQERPKYKEFLATMLSMVSINVMSGDVASCSLHLKAASKLITETSKWKTNYSNKAVALHRIYFYLSTIYDSTNVRVASTSGQLPDELDMTSPESHRFGSIEDTRIPTSPAAGFYDPKNVGAYESIYAIPKDLLVLLAKTTELINLITDAREESGDRQIPPALAERCDELEASIMNWQAEPQPPDISSSPIANPNIIYNMTRAFHKAIIIFFAQNVGLLGHWYLRHFVEEVINSIEAVEHIKIEWQVSASPLYWPAFIAASEAFDRGLQDRFKAWYAQVEPKAIGSINTAIRLLQDVWAEGPSTLSHKTSMWRHIAGRDGVILMLN